MKEITKQKIRLTAREILLSLLDIPIFIFELSDKHRLYRRSLAEYHQLRAQDKEDFYTQMHGLKKRGMIEIYNKDKKREVRLTKKGREKSMKYWFEELKAIKSPKVWDKRWRVIIFDIPNKKKTARDVLRQKFNELGFLKIQKSVYIFPFECRAEIHFLVDCYEIRAYIQYLVVDEIDSDLKILDHFIEQGTLTVNQIKEKEIVLKK